MYLQEDIKKVISRMGELYDSPSSTIGEQTKLSRPTINKFFNMQTIRPSSVEIIYELCLDLIEVKEKKLLKVNEKKKLLFKEA